MRIVRPSLLSVVAFGLLLCCVSGLSGCDSKPENGAMVEDGAQISPEQKSKIKGFYADRIKGAAKKK